MAKPPNEDLETFLRRQDAVDLVAVLLELAKDHEAVQARLARMQPADRPDKLAAVFKKTLSGWRRSTKSYGYREAGEFGRTLDGWLDHVERELLPKDRCATARTPTPCSGRASRGLTSMPTAQPTRWRGFRTPGDTSTTAGRIFWPPPWSGSAASRRVRRCGNGWPSGQGVDLTDRAEASDRAAERISATSSCNPRSTY